MNLEAYLPALLFVVVGIDLDLTLMTTDRVLSPNSLDPDKLLPYERDFEAFGDVCTKFDVCYYLITILFTLFGLETAFPLPWDVALRKVGWLEFLTMGVFLLEFLMGSVYIWKRGALD